MKAKQKTQNVVPVTSTTVAAAPAGSFQILGVTEVANLLGVPPSSVYEWCRFRAGNRGATIPHRKLGKYLKFIRAEVEAWILNMPRDVRTTKRPYRRAL
jgi:predicted DNA-binding transcriptional regulator AlpA